jgi:hypothetical protein
MLDPMKHLAYTHSVNKSLAETLGGWVRQMLPGPLKFPRIVGGRVPITSRILVCVGWMLVLVIQAGLLVLIAELVEVIHGVMELYLDLAQQQLDLTSLYVAATSK